MLFPHAGSATGSGPSSVAGSSSVGSHSPDLAVSPTPPPALLDRGRRRTTQKASPRVGEQGGAREGESESGEGWIGIGEDDGGDTGESNIGEGDTDGDDDGGGFSGVLADAILKRPGSIRGLSSKKGKFKEKDQEKEALEHTEFTFPSLSELGNVNRGPSRPVVVPPPDNERVYNDAKDEKHEADKTIEPIPCSEEFQQD